MFDENFSFLSSTTSPSYCGSNDTAPSSPNLSPFSSRCSSPLLQPVRHTSSPLALRQRDNRFNSRPTITKVNVPRHPSITALTADFESHVLNSPSELSISSFPYSNVSTPNTEPDDLDEGFVEPAYHHTSSRSDTTFAPSLWDLSMANLNTTSCPSDSVPSFSLRRRQRQALARLQCLARRTPDIAMLMEECHPSSLPLMDTGRSKSISSNCGRMEKERLSGAGVVKRMPRMRKRATR
jgi:hypothetical protein